MSQHKRKNAKQALGYFLFYCDTEGGKTLEPYINHLMTDSVGMRHYSLSLAHVH